MPTELKSKKASSKSDDAELRRHFAELETRIRRTDLATCLLVLSLAIVSYALLMGLFALLTYNSQADWVSVFRWGSYAGFAILMGFLFFRTIRCAFQSINPYYLAHQLEQTAPDAKNSLINWVDLRDEDLPAAFRRHLTMRAAEQLTECDPEPIVRRRKNRTLLAILPVPALGLLILLLLGPWSFFSSMLQAFAPFVEASSDPLTQITLLQPASEDAEVDPNQSLTFTAKIEGSVPPSGRPDAPKLLYRYQATEKYLVQPLQQDAGGTWSAQLLTSQLSTGILYRVTAGDAMTPEYRVRRGTGARVTSFTITYHYRDYYKFAPKPVTFPNDKDTRPFIYAPAGTKIELVAHTNRPVQKASVEFIVNKAIDSMTVQTVTGNPQAFACSWTLKQSGGFRVRFVPTQGEEYIDRNEYKVQVTSESAPRVILKTPAEHVDWPENGTLFITGEAESGVGLKNLTLRLRVVKGMQNPPKLQDRVYSSVYKLSDGTYRPKLKYDDGLPLDKLKDDKGGIQLLPPGTVLEYWLEATDASDYPNPSGNVGKSQPPHTIKIMPALNPEQYEADRQKALLEQKRRQDKQLAEDNAARAKGKDGSSGKTTQSKGDGENNQQSAQDATNKIQKALQQQSQGSKSPEDAGNNKDKGDKQNSSGESKGNADQKEGDKKKDTSKGERKDGPKESSSPAKDQGGMGKPEPVGDVKDDAPKEGKGQEAATAKENASESGAPMPESKKASPEGTAKGGEQERPEAGNQEKPAPSPMQGPTAQNKAGKPTSPEQANQKERSLDEVAKLLEKMPQRDAEGNDAAKELAEVGKKTGDERLRDLVKEALEKNQRDPETGKPLDKKPNQVDKNTPFDPKLNPDGPKSKDGKEVIKGPNPNGTLGTSSGRNDDLKTMAANREFLRRIGQMQLDDWKKRVTPDLLKRAGVSEAEANQAYDAMIRKLNARLKAKTDLRGASVPMSSGPTVIEGGKTGDESLDGASAEPPPEFRDAQRRFITERTGP